MKPTVYLTNAELLAELNCCKATFGTFLDPSFASFDLIVDDLAKVTPELLASVAATAKKPVAGLIVRHMTWDHIPLNEGKPGRAANKTHAKVNFPPYRHYLNTEAGLVEVGRSHWVGSFEDGHFTTTKGRITERMGKMLYKLVDRYGKRANFRNYSYNDEMQALALVQLSQVALQFDESKSSNPFSFYSTTITRVFLRVLSDEKKQQTLRDDILWSEGAAPSATRQAEWDVERMGLKELPPLAAKRGRPNKATRAALLLELPLRESRCA